MTDATSSPTDKAATKAVAAATRETNRATNITKLGEVLGTEFATRLTGSLAEPDANGEAKLTDVSVAILAENPMAVVSAIGQTGFAIGDCLLDSAAREAGSKIKVFDDLAANVALPGKIAILQAKADQHGFDCRDARGELTSEERAAEQVATITASITTSDPDTRARIVAELQAKLASLQ